MDESRVSVVFFDAHAADMVNSSGGTIANYTRAGHRVTLVGLTAGEKGNPTLDADAYRKLKIEAWERSAEILGVSDVRTLKWKDAELPYNEEVTNTCCDIIREVRADIVVTHWRGSFHKDHVATYHSVMDGVMLAGLPAFERDDPAHSVRRVYFTDNWEDWDDFTPDVYVDISDTLELKLEAIEQFVRAYMTGRTGGFDYKGFYQALAKMRGCLSQAFTYAETYATAGRRIAQGSLLPL
jgi:LmbE family N-acetylglucosaminyl deacetylase